MSTIFSSDISTNRGLLSQHVLRQAVQPQADDTLRAATCRLFFDYVDIETGGTAFFTLIPIASHAMFDDLIKLLLSNTQEVVNGMPSNDTSTRKTYAQQHLAKMLLRRDRRGENAVFKCLLAGKHSHMGKITSLLYNDNMAIKVSQRGEMVRQEVIISKNSLAPSNPLLSLLLAQDSDGNTAMHHAVMRNDLQGLKLLMSGLAPNDMYAIIKSFVNKAGLTLWNLTQPEIAKAKLGQAAVNQWIPPARAKEMFMAIGQINSDMKAYLEARVNEIDELATSLGRKEPLPPTFQLPHMR
jgi:ankyrin repeat protein